MANLDFRFDEITEQYSKRELEAFREFASTTTLPERVSVEIGSNRGRFLTALSQDRPDHFHLGIEIRHKWVKQSKKSIEKLHIDNADVICGDANLALPIVFDDGQIDDIYILYPDPWWKARHHKRRLIQPKFLDLLHTKMKPEGRVIIRTDVGPLADAMREELTFHPHFFPLDPQDYDFNALPLSTRERSSIEQDIPLNLVYFQHS